MVCQRKTSAVVFYLLNILGALTIQAVIMSENGILVSWAQDRVFLSLVKTHDAREHKKKSPVSDKTVPALTRVEAKMILLSCL